MHSGRFNMKREGKKSFNGFDYRAAKIVQYTVRDAKSYSAFIIMLGADSNPLHSGQKVTKKFDLVS